MPLLAFTTSGIFSSRPGTTGVQGFFDQAPEANAAASRFEAHVHGSARICVHPSTPPYPVEDTFPEYYLPGVHGGIGCTLSIWRTIEAVFSYAYSGPHALASAHRREWCIKGDRPAYAAWWMNDEDAPTSAEASARLDHLHGNGSTPFAFNFKSPYDATGKATTVDRDLATQLIDAAQLRNRT